MKKLALSAGASLIILGSISPADAQFGYRHGYYGGGWGSHHYGRYHRGWGGCGWGGGGAVAAGLVGGLVLGGIAAAAAAPPYGYGYPAYPYGYGYPPAYYGRYYARPVYRTRYIYGPRAYDPYAAPHEIRGGYRTVYRDGRRVIVAPAYW